MITRNHLDWFRLKCPYPVESKDFKSAYKKLNGATYADLERLRQSLKSMITAQSQLPITASTMNGLPPQAIQQRQ